MAEFRGNPAKKKLAEGGLVTLVMGDYSPDMCEFLGSLGFDAVMGEMEHFTTSWQDIANMSRACDLWGMMSMVRINRNDPALITRTLDCGANGIMVPHVDTAEQARAVAVAAKYGPDGIRGQFGGRRSFGITSDYHRQANEHVMTTVLLEDIVAIKNLPEILTVDGIDVFWVVPGDLAQSLGYTGQVNHPEVRKVMDQAIADIVNAGRHAGTLVNDDTIEDAIAKGVSMVSVSWTNWLAAGARAFLARAKK
ncbi:MAG TPA: aldolase/citrate lyase family protein [Nonomuraea sp.]|nr:aldolase/citrate lyase family protein [Nonomuraea sp.]